VELWTDRTERLRCGATLVSDVGELQVAAARAHQGRFLVRFEGVADRMGAETLRGLELRATPLHVEGALWVHELVGARVVTAAGLDVGTVVALEPNPASDLLVLEGGALVPLRFVTALEPGVRVTVDVPDGLFD
jgi:16S rRNA processing protein RimM